mmetsp:Transcript_57122/g.150534  ORF Transcript_57122/g.150534 Transcript_57122/m.150534 type:complete len:260 (+) Transcript_57122:160-939(+)
MLFLHVRGAHQGFYVVYWNNHTLHLSCSDHHHPFGIGLRAGPEAEISNECVPAGCIHLLRELAHRLHLLAVPVCLGAVRGERHRRLRQHRHDGVGRVGPHHARLLRPHRLRLHQRHRLLLHGPLPRRRRAAHDGVGPPHPHLRLAHVLLPRPMRRAAGQRLHHLRHVADHGAHDPRRLRLGLHRPLHRHHQPLPQHPRDAQQPQLTSPERLCKCWLSPSFAEFGYPTEERFPAPAGRDPKRHPIADVSAMGRGWLFYLR